MDVRPLVARRCEMRIGSVFLLLACVLTGGADDDAKKPAAVVKALKRLEGTWKVVSIVQGGREQSEDTLGEVMTFKDGKLTERGRQEDDKDEPRQLRLDPTCDPK